MKVAIVHDWLIHMRGGEKVLDGIAELFPNATIYTLLSDKKKLSQNLKRMPIKNSFLHYFPGVKHYYRWLLPILPFAIRSLKIDEDTDLVVSSSHCVAKGIRKPEKAFHVCYCHTPARYLWGFEDIYFKRYLWPVRALIRVFLNILRDWDLKVNEGVDFFIANSECVRERILKFYKRDAAIVNPPTAVDFFAPGLSKEDYYLAVSHFVPYKRLDLVIEAFNRLDRKLFVAGSGPLEHRYQTLRKSSNIYFLGAVSDEELRALYSSARALIFPAEEDFGIVPLEAQSCGTPVIAYGKGGSLETVKSGIFFDEQTVEAVKNAVERFETHTFDPAVVRTRVEGFGRNGFLHKMRTVINEALNLRKGKIS